MIEFVCSATSFQEVKFVGKEEQEILNYMEEHECGMEEAIFELEDELCLFDRLEMEIEEKKIFNISFSKEGVN